MPRAETPRFGLRRLVVALSTALILLIGIGVPAAIIAPVPAAVAEVAAASRTDTAAARVRMPSFGSSAIGALDGTGVLATSGPQQPRTIASITKVVTALVVLQAKPITGAADGPTITFTQRDVDVLADVIADDGSSEPVQAGWRASERAALTTMLVPSANNYAESLALWAYGSMPAFLTAARAWLAAHHLDHTRLFDANGLSTRNVSTPTDLVALGRLALADPVVASIVKRSTADEPNVGVLDNTNQLLGRVRSGIVVDGLKTGTYPTGANLLFSARLTVGAHVVRVVGVVLGASTHEQLDARVPAMLASVRAGYHEVVLARKGQAFGTYLTRWGGVGRAVAVARRTALVWGRADVRRHAAIDPITGGRRGVRVGVVRFTVGGRTSTVRLELDRDVLAAPLWWRLTHPLR